MSSRQSTPHHLHYMHYWHYLQYKYYRYCSLGRHCRHYLYHPHYVHRDWNFFCGTLNKRFIDLNMIVLKMRISVLL